jgi:hemolysin-activating ACP:hemolysin acyltransferase
MASVFDWLELHSLDDEGVIRILSHSDCELQIAPCRGSLDVSRSADGIDQSDFHLFLTGAVVPALEAAIDCVSISDLLGSVSWQVQQGSSDHQPHTVDRGGATPPEVVLNWDGSPESQICLAHEAGHALQLMLSSGNFMPPVAREVCAFFAELALISWADINDPVLAAGLRHVWNSDNDLYLLDDRDELLAALADPAAQYHYRLNYPLARIAAVRLFREGSREQVSTLFRSGGEAMSLLGLSKIAALLKPVESTLPPLPCANEGSAALSRHQMLGAIALLDSAYWKGEPERKIKDYYRSMQRHLADGTLVLATDDLNRPIGYATWQPAAEDEAPTVLRFAAPFGNTHRVKEALSEHIRGDLNQVLRRRTTTGLAETA